VHNYMPMKYDALGDFQAGVCAEDMFRHPRLQTRNMDPGLALPIRNLAARLGALIAAGSITLIDKVVRLSLRPIPASRPPNKQGPRDADERPGPASSGTWRRPTCRPQAESWGWPDVRDRRNCTSIATTALPALHGGNWTRPSRPGDHALHRHQPWSGKLFEEP